MAAHGPYDYAYMPEVDVPGGGAGTHPEMHEFLRRLAMTRMDYAICAPSSRAASRPAVPRSCTTATTSRSPHASCWGSARTPSVEDVLRGGNPAALESHYALDAVNYRLPPLAALERVDVPYLGTAARRRPGCRSRAPIASAGA